MSTWNIPLPDSGRGEFRLTFEGHKDMVALVREGGEAKNGSSKNHVSTSSIKPNYEIDA